MGKRIVIIQGHPDAAGAHLGHALAAAYRQGAEQAGHQVRMIEVARLDFGLVRSKAEWDAGEPPADIRDAQQDIAWAEHLVICYPLWLGGMPALLKGFLEQVLRPGFAVGTPDDPRNPRAALLRGRSARVVITMGMPGWVYRWFFGAHSLKSLERNILAFCGIKPVRATLVGGIDGLDAPARADWLARLARLGAAAR